MTMWNYHAPQCGENFFNLFLPNVPMIVKNFETILEKVFVLVNLNISVAKTFLLTYETPGVKKFTFAVDL